MFKRVIIIATISLIFGISITLASEPRGGEKGQVLSPELFEGKTAKTYQIRALPNWQKNGRSLELHLTESLFFTAAQDGGQALPSLSHISSALNRCEIMTAGFLSGVGGRIVQSLQGNSKK